MTPLLVKCGICHEGDGRYKCPKCGVRYCSLKCYKDIEKHTHKEAPELETDAESNLEDINKKSSASKSTSATKQCLKTKAFDDVYQNSAQLQELLNYNTVKFHLAKVYRILSTNVNDGSSGNMNSDLQRELAVNYLNTLRYGGIHYNEAIEEFCQILLHKLNEAKE
ncbi:hit1p [Saccharomyces arboricola H-6]|uniref:Hit1p n=1 Tax=Saccharomyces arboricola (strain H-6 / AS 2.3317 / CBS 10644) TaxID=1160507 RepID=J8Q610_SACAR|nr:hit1p [Saccharomyces arboricola H-6]